MKAIAVHLTTDFPLLYHNNNRIGGFWTCNFYAHRTIGFSPCESCKQLLELALFPRGFVSLVHLQA